MVSEESPVKARLIELQPANNPLDLEQFREETKPVMSSMEDERKDWPVSYGHQCSVLFSRAFFQQKGEIFTVVNFLQSVVMALLVGAMYFQVPQEAAYVQDRLGYVSALISAMILCLDSLANFCALDGNVEYRLTMV